MKLPNALLAAMLLAVPGRLAAQPLSYFLHPPGCVWGLLTMTNTSAVGLAACPGGVVVAANHFEPPGPGLGVWGLLAKVSTDTGAVLFTTNLQGELRNNQISDIIPITAGGGTVEGFAFTGRKYYSSPPWAGDWTWLVKLDLSLVKQAEAHVGTVSHTGWGNTLIQEPSGFVVGGNEAYMGAGSSWDWLGRFDAALNLIAQTNLPGGCESIFALAPGIGGGYVTGTGNTSPFDDDCSSVVKINASLGFEWQVADVPAAPGCTRDHYFDLKPVADGYVALGTRTCSGAPALVLTKFAGDGAVVWSRVNSHGRGSDLVPSPDGGWLVVGTSPTRRLDDVPCLWLLKTDSLGQTVWEMCLGGDHGASGAAGVEAADGNYIVAGEAIMADGTNRVWVVKVDSRQQAPVAAFTFSPASPVFRDQTVTFDASASTAPGSAMASYEWEFGDGTTATGMIVTHTYRELGTNTVTLTVVNTNAVLTSTSQQIVVVGLAVQWERFYGSERDDIGYSLVEARDGGFVIAGAAGKPSSDETDFWVFKTDARGRLVWNKILDDTNSMSSEVARCVVRAHDSGYAIAGYNYAFFLNFLNWLEEPWLVKVDENGELAWPIRVFGVTNRDDNAYGVAATSDGGYLLTGSRKFDIGTTDYPWLLKTDAHGIESWNRTYTNDYTSVGRCVAQTADGGYLWGCGPFLVTFKTDAAGVPLWTNVFGSGGSADNGGRWIAERPGGGAVVVGGNRDMVMRFLSTTGAVTGSWSWSAPDGSDYTDNAECAAFTPDGGCIVGGFMTLRNTTYSQHREVALIKTDSAGNTHWIETLPGTTNRDETAYGVVALPDGAYVVLAHRQVTSSADPIQRSVWLFKLAQNHPPVPRMTSSPSPAAPGQTITFDGTASTDSDGTVVAWEWDFGDGTTTHGAVVQHTYTNAGSFAVCLTVVDNAGAERSITNWTCAPGILPLASGVTLTLAEVTNAPAADPAHYPPAGAPADLDWASAFGFRLGAAGPDGNQAFRIAFCGTIDTNFVLYWLPAWTAVPYTHVNQVAIDVSLTIAGGVVNTHLVLARAVPSCRIVRCELAGADRLALTFTTESGYRCRVRSSPQLVPADWQPVNHARTVTDPLALETLTGTGAAETVFVARPGDAAAFFRLQVESALP